MSDVHADLHTVERRQAVEAHAETNWDRWGRRLATDFGFALAAYAVILPSSLWVLRMNPDASWRFPIAIAPAVPIVFLVRAMLRGIRRMGELEQRIHAEALVTGFWGSAVVMFSYGFLVNAGFPQVNWTWTWPVMLATWGVGVAMASRRYKL